MEKYAVVYKQFFIFWKIIEKTNIISFFSLDYEEFFLNILLCTLPILQLYVSNVVSINSVRLVEKSFVSSSFWVSPLDVS